MKLMHSILTTASGFLFIILLTGILAGASSCKWFQKGNNEQNPKPDTTTFKQKVSWNILFKDNVSSNDKEKAIENIKNSVKKFYADYNKRNGTRFNAIFERPAYCPCDPTLLNLNFGASDTSGRSAPSAPASNDIQGEGGMIESVTDNVTIIQPIRQNFKEVAIRKHAVDIPAFKRDPARILAIIDSGIDTSLFTTPIQSLMWSNPSGPTIYNFIPYESQSDFSDGGSEKHGSAVTALAINGMKSAKSYPRIMILKAIDANNHGTIFSVSCALSYAIQNNATLVNASLGYLGAESPVLKKYITLCKNHAVFPIQLFFAAGNTPGTHPDPICNTGTSANELTGSSLFYPACFSTQFNNITSVTQIREPELSCYYQYYSKVYINLGVLNSKHCCSFQVDFRADTSYYEGSSFATPIASGMKMATIINTNDGSLSNSLWDNTIVKSSAPGNITKGGKYVIH